MTNRSWTLLAAADVIRSSALAEQLEQPDVLTEAVEAFLRGEDVYQVEGGIRSLLESGHRAPVLTSSSAGALLAASQPVLHSFERRLILRDLIPTQPMTTFAEMFVRELNPVADEAGVTGVPEGALKPDDSAHVEFIPTNVAPGVLAVTLPEVSKQLVEDSSAFVAWLRRRLPYKTLVREEYAFLFGDGAADVAGITGIANTAGVSTGTGAADMATAITNAERGVADIADGVVVNKNDWATLRQTNPDFCRALNDDLAVVRTTAMPSGTVIAGAWSNGALILDRQQTTIDFLNQHLDDALRGKFAVRCEEQVGLWVAEPQSFAVRTWS